ncbi:AMP-binding protein [Longimicrobium terrae]|uniref:Acetyl-CoA synthetase n=1 Tax=Longimicrobium terrae TaxID=1639882 RepID=A0A841H4Y8_9BACT|nr:AMP-binding protein [Longimicrobium terrae]MBB4638962.1 acetyl-CoA synthetase [Longimicrobium terrae]MBB6073201.1 acetyl-CoA synthetase [Longimicrobium terrae]NNC32344.1 AMP-binding protein [Longimicrobium terrae]
MIPQNEFAEARRFLLDRRGDYDAAYEGFQWPTLEHFNWALDWFDAYAAENDAPALHLVDDAGVETVCSFREMSERSNRVANFLRAQGARRGDRLLLMLPNVAPLWEVMLAAIKLGVVIVPTTTQLTVDDLRDRVRRGAIRHVIADAEGAPRLDEVPGAFTRVIVGEERAGWTAYHGAAAHAPVFTPDGETRGGDPMLLYFTSGTTSVPKLVLHTHRSYPAGHLSTMYWIGIREGDVHWNVSSPGWAKHAWSNVFAPWNAGACVFVFSYARFDARRVLDMLVRHAVTTLCAPPTVWRFLINEDLSAWPVRLREVASAGEPLNPEVIERVRAGWGLTIRDGYGQTETTAQIGNPPGQPLRPGSMGRPLPGYRVALLDADGNEGDEGEIALRLDPPPAALMSGYLDDPARTDEAMRGGYYRTGDVATRGEGGYITYVGRTDDVFKSSDYRISPFELESVMIEHPAVAEAAVVPSPDPLRLSVPKAYLVLRPGFEPSRELAAELFRFVRERMAAYKRVRRIEFSDLPKTISGKIRRVELRDAEQAGAHSDGEYRIEDFPELKDS